MKANVIGIDGSNKGSIELPAVFQTVYNPTVIQRAVLAIQTARLQPKGTDPRAGKKNTAVYVGNRGAPTAMRMINVEHARLPRLRNRRELLSGRVAFVPHSVGGRAAHPPKAKTVIAERVNKKEKRLALKSAIAASAVKALVERRFIVEKELPIIVDIKIEDTQKTKELVEILSKIGVGKDLENAREKTGKRAGRGKCRGRTNKVKKSVLIVSEKNSPVLKAARNIPGVDSVTVASLNVELLAPGAEAGRLVVWTTGAIEALRNGKITQEKAKKELKFVKEEKKEVEKKVVKKVVKKKAKEKGID